MKRLAVKIPTIEQLIIVFSLLGILSLGSLGYSTYSKAQDENARLKNEQKIMLEQKYSKEKSNLSASNNAASNSPSTSSSQSPQSKSPTNVTSPKSKLYVAPYCTNTSIPHQYLTEYVSWLGAGATFASYGSNGNIKSCTADSNGYKPPDVTTQPINQIGYVGTGSSSNSGLTQAQIDAARQARIAECKQYVTAASHGQASTSACNSIP